MRVWEVHLLIDPDSPWFDKIKAALAVDMKARGRVDLSGKSRINMDIVVMGSRRVLVLVDCSVDDYGFNTTWQGVGGT